MAQEKEEEDLQRRRLAAEVEVASAAEVQKLLSARSVGAVAAEAERGEPNANAIGAGISAAAEVRWPAPGAASSGGQRFVAKVFPPGSASSGQVFLDYVKQQNMQQDEAARLLQSTAQVSGAKVVEASHKPGEAVLEAQSAGLQWRAAQVQPAAAAAAAAAQVCSGGDSPLSDMAPKSPVEAAFPKRLAEPTSPFKDRGNNPPLGVQVGG